MSRIKRKNREDIVLKDSGGMLDLIDNWFKATWRVNDEEYDYMVEHSSDEELGLLTRDDLSLTEAKKSLTIVENLLEAYGRIQK